MIRFIGLVLLALFVLTLMVVPCFGAWGSSPASTVVEPAVNVPTIAPGYHGWYTAGQFGPGWEVQYEAGHLVAARCRGQYYTWSNGRWATVRGDSIETLPMMPHDNAKPIPVAHPRNFGVDTEKVAEYPTHTICGNPASREEALAVLEANELPDESGKKAYLILFGPDDVAAQVSASLDQVPNFRARVHFVHYPRGDWHERAFALNESVKFKDKPIVSLLECLDGEVCHIQGSAPTVDDLKKMDQHFSPDKAPDLRRSWMDDVSEYADNHQAVCICGGVGVLLLLAGRKKS